jgi:hypothetical protein
MDPARLPLHQLEDLQHQLTCRFSPQLEQALGQSLLGRELLKCMLLAVAQEEDLVALHPAERLPAVVRVAAEAGGHLCR